MQPIRTISDLLGSIARAIVVYTGPVLTSIVLVVAVILALLESLISGVPTFETTINFLHEVIDPSLTTAGKLGLVAILFGTVAAFGHWGPFWIIAIRHGSGVESRVTLLAIVAAFARWGTFRVVAVRYGSGLISQVRNNFSLAASLFATAPSTSSCGAAILARSLFLCSPSRVGLSTSAGLSGASPLRL